MEGENIIWRDERGLLRVEPFQPSLSRFGESVIVLDPHVLTNRPGAIEIYAADSTVIGGSGTGASTLRNKRALEDSIAASDALGKILPELSTMMYPELRVRADAVPLDNARYIIVPADKAQKTIDYLLQNKPDLRIGGKPWQERLLIAPVEGNEVRYDLALEKPAEHAFTARQEALAATEAPLALEARVSVLQEMLAPVERPADIPAEQWETMKPAILRSITAVKPEGSMAPDNLLSGLEERIRNAPEVVRLKRLLGSGGIGVVFFADVRLPDGTVVEKAVKFLGDSVFEQPMLKGVSRQEIAITTFLNDVVGVPTDVSQDFVVPSTTKAKYAIGEEIGLPLPSGWGLVRVPGDAPAGSAYAYMMDVVSGKDVRDLTPQEARVLKESGVDAKLEDLVTTLFQRGYTMYDIRNNVLFDPATGDIRLIDPGVLDAMPAWMRDYERAAGMNREDPLAAPSDTSLQDSIAEQYGIDPEQARLVSTLDNPDYGAKVLRDLLDYKAREAGWEAEDIVIEEIPVSPETAGSPVLVGETAGVQAQSPVLISGRLSGSNAHLHGIGMLALAFVLLVLLAFGVRSYARHSSRQYSPEDFSASMRELRKAVRQLRKGK
jgi:hypothetical protein